MVCCHFGGDDGFLVVLGYDFGFYVVVVGYWFKVVVEGCGCGCVVEYKRERERERERERNKK